MIDSLGLTQNMSDGKLPDNFAASLTNTKFKEMIIYFIAASLTD